MTRIRTTTVGSWPIPFGKRPELKRYYAGKLSDGQAHEVLQAAARIAMDEQLACGLDQIMGGEVFAPDFVHHVPPRLSGLKTLRPRDTGKGYEGVGVYAIDGDVGAPRGTGHALGFRRERAIEPRLEKAAVPSPLTIGLSFQRDPRFADSCPTSPRSYPPRWRIWWRPVRSRCSSTRRRRRWPWRTRPTRSRS